LNVKRGLIETRYTPGFYASCQGMLANGLPQLVVHILGILVRKQLQLYHRFLAVPAERTPLHRTILAFYQKELRCTAHLAFHQKELRFTAHSWRSTRKNSALPHIPGVPPERTPLYRTFLAFP